MWKIKLRRFFGRARARGRYMAAPGRRRRAAFAVAAVILLFGTVAIKIEPEMRKMAGYMISTQVTECLNEVIGEKIADGGMEYSSLVTLEKDSGGRVTALMANMAKINALQAEITAGALSRLSDRMKTAIKIPLGNIIGGTVLSGRGPDIPVKILSVSNMTAGFSNEFTAAGINQTRHRIVLDFTVDIDMLIPGRTVSDTVRTSVVVAETVIVGDVPDTYADIYGGEKNQRRAS